MSTRERVINVIQNVPISDDFSTFWNGCLRAIGSELEELANGGEGAFGSYRHIFEPPKPKPKKRSSVHTSPSLDDEVVLGHLRQRGGEFGCSELAELTGYPSRAVTRAIQRLKRRGAIEQIGKGRGATYKIPEETNGPGDDDE